MSLRNQRKSRVQAPCCGRYRYRYQLEHDGDGNYYCDACWALTPPALAQVEPPAAPELAAPAGDAAAGVEPPAVKAVLVPRDDCAVQPAKKCKRTHTGKRAFWNQNKSYGYAHFEGFPERVLVHAKDCNGQPTVGEAVSAIVHRRTKDGKLQAFSLERKETMEARLGRIHQNLLGSKN